nr:MFS transporter [Pseudofrankia asymbiotica]
MAVAGALLAAIGTIMLTHLVTDEPRFVAAFLPTWVVLGLGYGLAVPTAITRATVGLPPKDSATGSAIVTMATQLGSVIGISVLVAILGRASGAASHAVFQHAWYVSAGALVAAALASFGLDSPATAPSRPDLPPARASAADANDPEAARL